MSNKEKLIPIQCISVQPEEDEIDIKEIIKIILKYKKFIVIFTLLITVLAMIYIFLKKPIYEIQSNIMIGQINGKPVVSNKEVAEYIKALYKKEIEKKFQKMPNAYLSNIILPKKTDTFLTLIIDGINNQYDLKKKNQILKNIQDAYNFKIKKYIILQQNKIQNLNTTLKSIDIIKVNNIKNKIKNLENNIQINNNLINFYKNKIKTLNDKIKFLNNEIKKISYYLNQLIKKNNTSSNLIISTNIMNYQNLLTNLFNQINNLKLEKDQILSQTLPNLENKNQQILNNIYNLKNQLKIQIPQEKENIKNQIQLINLSIKNTFFTKEIGKPLMFDYPIKPKKKLIIIIAFITGFVFSIFLVFLIEFIKSLKESE